MSNVFNLFDEVVIVSDNENYNEFKDTTLRIIKISTSSKQHPGYDEGMKGMPLYDLMEVNGKHVPFSLYQYEIDYAPSAPEMRRKLYVAFDCDQHRSYDSMRLIGVFNERGLLEYIRKCRRFYTINEQDIDSDKAESITVKDIIEQKVEGLHVQFGRVNETLNGVDNFV